MNINFGSRYDKRELLFFTLRDFVNHSSFTQCDPSDNERNC